MMAPFVWSIAGGSAPASERCHIGVGSDVSRMTLETKGM